MSKLQQELREMGEDEDIEFVDDWDEDEEDWEELDDFEYEEE
jgi:GTP-binding protein